LHSIDSRWWRASITEAPDPKHCFLQGPALSTKFSEGKYITAWWNPTLYVDYRLIEECKLNKVEVENAAQAFLRDPGVEAVFTRTQMEQGMMPNTKLARQVILAWHQQISGDIVVMNSRTGTCAKPGTYASTHGSPCHTTPTCHLRCTARTQAGKIRRLRSGEPRSHHRFYPQCAASERLRGTSAFRGRKAGTYVLDSLTQSNVVAAPFLPYKRLRGPRLHRLRRRSVAFRGT
jgi:hypothetical protein